MNEVELILEQIIEALEHHVRTAQKLETLNRQLGDTLNRLSDLGRFAQLQDTELRNVASLCYKQSSNMSGAAELSYAMARTNAELLGNIEALREYSASLRH